MRIELVFNKIIVILSGSVLLLFCNFLIAAGSAKKDSQAESMQQSKVSSLQVGDLYGGGKVFYIDMIERIVLIASLSDQTQTNQVSWSIVPKGLSIKAARDSGKTNFISTGANHDGTGAGALNTKKIITIQGTGNTAAELAANYNIQENGVDSCTRSVDEICHDDWYLPSKRELNLLYRKKDLVGNFSGWIYRSSTESDEIRAWTQLFTEGVNLKSGATVPIYKDELGSVRAIRAISY